VVSAHTEQLINKHKIKMRGFIILPFNLALKVNIDTPNYNTLVKWLTPNIKNFCK